MERIKIVIAYDGSTYKGWQIQPGERTVQDSLESAIKKITGADVRVQGSGRTDTGVHALGQVAHYEVSKESRMDSGEWQRALNVNLPKSIRILSVEKAPLDFHARFSAKAKTYRYEVDTSPVLVPHKVDRVWHHPSKIDGKVLKAACQLYVGTHDFASFAGNRGNSIPTSTERTIFSIDVESHQDTISMSFSGNGFLYKMVRLLVGAAVRVAEGREDIEWIKKMLQDPGKNKCQYCAKPDGLYLVEVSY
ncbi:MAG: tRNA pseudouridine(38-40) synthase TruA [Verrucomicrobiales bacterium]|nr:tRNA pseudouridine(38-40) synthase TruA [Verrucomicrobiales bacterium]OUU86614.1 MAG: tRNA pseudouridine(38-40) synthase TruA [Verrucomicrobiaceae bacterium TMED76]RCL32269.1 MAG: tRNA pseudouridine(38-40) synthase TruA [Verrucomicrobiota bacterium]|tara:strand:+ start:137 stop:883 length:747 start_codon:yes stop_codon:yes gene_type:complete